MFVHHFFGGSGRIKRKDKQIHCVLRLTLTLTIVDDGEIRFSFLFLLIPYFGD
jgi:hypothetical protein